MGLFNFQKHNKVKVQTSVVDEALNSERNNENIPDAITVDVSEKSRRSFVVNPEAEEVVEIDFTAKLQNLAPRPSTLTETGLSTSLLLELLVKHLQAGGVYTLRELAEKLALSGGIVQELLEQAKGLSWVENRQSSAEGQMRYALSHLGELQAGKAFLKNGYLGRAPLPLAQYLNVAKTQSSRSAPLSKPELDKAFNTLTFPAELIEKIGPALNSTKPILIYGNPGTGKSYFCRHLNLAFGDQVLIPYALEVNNEIIQIFDPEMHQVTYQSNSNDLLK
ncbi:MAG: hypothetical protein OQK77_04410, partial [Psychromonas sp.]|nr:hypothetical protein [Psychromonas sp.]